MTKRLEVGDVSYQFQIWDTAGQEKVGITYTAESQQNARMDYCKSGYSCFMLMVSVHVFYSQTIRVDIKYADA